MMPLMEDLKRTIKGSLEVGKVADLVILSGNLLMCDDLDILNAKILYTIVDGEIKFKQAG